MKPRLRRLLLAFQLTIILVSLICCAVVQQMQDALGNVRRLQFKLKYPGQIDIVDKEFTNP